MRMLLVLANSFMDNLIPLGVSLLSGALKKEGNEIFDNFKRTYLKDYML